MKDFGIEVDFSSSLPFYKQIYNQIVFALNTGRLKPGDKLYHITMLAKKLGVSVNTVSKSYRMLELKGYLAKVKGKGAYITKKK
ncbi:MAG: GntR family transcriptional regulator [Spirochaetales bacterium]|nr:GntR family transcriptional regulator [Spirochaetales bacterium]